MFERFTEKAIKVIMLAQEEARRLGHNFVGTEQILLGLIGEGTGVAAKVLKSMGVNLKTLVSKLKKSSVVALASSPLRFPLPPEPSAFWSYRWKKPVSLDTTTLALSTCSLASSVRVKA